MVKKKGEVFSWWPDFDGDLMVSVSWFMDIHGKSRNGKKSFSFSSSSCTTPEMVPLASLFASQVDSWSRVHHDHCHKGQKPLEHELSWKMIVTDVTSLLFLLPESCWKLLSLKSYRLKATAASLPPLSFQPDGAALGGNQVCPRGFHGAFRCWRIPFCAFYQHGTLQGPHKTATLEPHKTWQHVLVKN